RGDRAALRAAWRRAAHARGGGPCLRRDARANPPDREQHAEEARAPARSAGPSRRSLLGGGVRVATESRVGRALERHEEIAVRALEAEVAGGAPAVDRLCGE